MNSLIEALKEAGRVIVLALVSYLLTAGVLQGILAAFRSHMDAGTQAIIIMLVTTVLKSIDTWLHEQGKTTGNKTLVTGLTRF